MTIEIVYVDGAPETEYSDSYYRKCLSKNQEWFDLRKCFEPHLFSRHHPLIVLWAKTFCYKGIKVKEVDSDIYYIESTDDYETIIDGSEIVVVDKETLLQDKKSVKAFEAMLKAVELNKKIEDLEAEITEKTKLLNDLKNQGDKNVSK